MDEETIEKVKKFLAILAALGGWIVSIVFSNQGFNFQVHNMIWAGWVLSFIITVVELVFNSQLKYGSRNYSIYVLGAFSYLYDVGTNIVGLWIAGGNTTFSMEMITDNFFGFLIYFFIAGLLAIAPEMLLVYGLVGITGSGEGDIIRNVLQIRDKSHQSPSANNHSFESLPPEFDGISRREARQQMGNAGSNRGHQQPPPFEEQPVYHSINNRGGLPMSNNGRSNNEGGRMNGKPGRKLF